MDKRAALKAKIAKLLAMARDGRGDANEEAIAMGMANRLMIEHGIEEAEVDMKRIEADEMEFGEVSCAPDGQLQRVGRVFRAMPKFAGVLALGVARFTDTICSITIGAQGRAILFRGEKDDVIFARWLFGVLVDSIQAAQKRSGWKGKSDGTTFRSSAASVLQARLTALAQERRDAYRKAADASGSKALMVVDRKTAEIQKRFGRQHFRSGTGGGRGSFGAREAGRVAGASINIPSGRPLEGSSSGSLPG